jgi:hypothetical protein
VSGDTGGGTEAAPCAERARLIADFCVERGVGTLLHFTRLENLARILTEGLLPRADLEREVRGPDSANAICNDAQRLDGHPDAVCLSIGFPNYRAFSRFRHAGDPDACWVVVGVGARVLWELDCAFNRENAASHQSRVVPIEQRKEFAALRAMFDDHGEPGRAVVRREDLDIPSHYPTHPQAEVLVFGRVPTEALRFVHFSADEIRQQWVAAHPGVAALTGRVVALSTNRKFFGYRADTETWRMYDVYRTLV